MPRLVLEGAPTHGARVVPLRRDLLVGRDARCDVVLDDPHVSGEHARLRVHDGTVVVVDLGSRNGTTVNGRPVPAEGMAVGTGDRIRFATVEATLLDAGPRAAVNPQAPRRDTAAGSRRRRVFVSYARADAGFVRPIARRLEQAGHDVWVDTDDLAAGSAWTGQIAEAIERSDALVVVLTSRSVESPEVSREVHLAASKQVPIIPVALTPLRIPGHLEYPLSGLQRIEASRDEPEVAARTVVQAVDHGLPRRQHVQARRRALRTLAAVLVLAGLALGVATAVTGAVPPWASQARCDDVALQVQPGQPASTPFASGAVFTVRISNRSDGTVRIPGNERVRVVAADGFQYDVERLPALGDWFTGFAVGPRATVERRLGVEAPSSRAGSDVVTVEVGSIVEDALPLLRCRALQEDVGATIAG